VHHGALAYLLGINALRASEAAAVRIEDYRETLRGHRVLYLIGKGQQAGHHAIDRPQSYESLRPVEGNVPKDASCYVRSPASRSTDATASA
jgi:hypothetical protein